MEMKHGIAAPDAVEAQRSFDRRMDVLRMRLDGMSYRQIARAVGVSPNAVVQQEGKAYRDLAVLGLTVEDLE